MQLWVSVGGGLDEEDVSLCAGNVSVWERGMGPHEQGMWEE
jgi:hypothetical protein